MKERLSGFGRAAGGVLKKVYPPLFWIAAWEALSLAVGRELLVASPFRVAQRMVSLAGTPYFWAATAMSLGRVTGGFVAGTAAGVVGAYLAFRHMWLRRLFEPLLTVMRSAPVASFIVLALVWMKSDAVTVFIAFIMTMPIIWSAVAAGLDNTDRTLSETARMYGFSNFKTLRLLYIPSAAPFFSSACVNAVGLSWKAGVAAEVLCTPAYSIGKKIYESKLYLETADLFAWTASLLIISLLLEYAVKKAARAAQGRFSRSKTACEVITPAPEAAAFLAPPEAVDFKKANDIILKDITKIYGCEAVLSKISLTLAAGSHTALLGPSGRGKTTLLRVVAGLEKPDCGAVSGAKMSEIAYMFQEPRLFLWLDALANVSCVIARPGGIKKEDADSLAAKWLEAVGLGGDANKYPAELSVGMARRVALARALAYGKPVLLLDEPFYGLDAETKKHMVALVKKESENKTLLMVTHDHDEAAALADCVISL